MSSFYCKSKEKRQVGVFQGSGGPPRIRLVCSKSSELAIFQRITDFMDLEI